MKHSALHMILWHLWQQKDKNSCTVRVRARAREGDYRYFHTPDLGMLISDSLFCLFPLLNVDWKQHVVLWKVSRRFMENNTSFCVKQAVVLRESYAHSNRQNRLFGGFALRTIEFLMIPPVTTCKKKTYSPSSSWQKWLISLAKHLINTLICTDVWTRTEVGVTHVTFCYQCALYLCSDIN